MTTYKLKYTGAEIDSKLDAVDNKQDKLTAGNGITISEDNIISTGDVGGGLDLYLHTLEFGIYDYNYEEVMPQHITLEVLTKDATPLTVGELKDSDVVSLCKSSNVVKIWATIGGINSDIKYNIIDVFDYNEIYNMGLTVGGVCLALARCNFTNTTKEITLSYIQTESDKGCIILNSSVVKF